MRRFNMQQHLLQSFDKLDDNKDGARKLVCCCVAPPAQPASSCICAGVIGKDEWNRATAGLRDSPDQNRREHLLIHRVLRNIRRRAASPGDDGIRQAVDEWLDENNCRYGSGSSTLVPPVAAASDLLPV